MRLIAARARLREEGGYTMIAVVGAISLVSMLAAATLAATNGDINLVQRDLDHRRAHAAAQAGIADYSFHLNNDNSYWSRCTSVPTPNAVNQKGSTTNKRSVPGPAGESYALELLPATGKSTCDATKPVESMLEQSGKISNGSFRVRSNGYAGKAKVSIVATYKRASLLDYVYFTQLETSDPVVYDSDTISGAYTQCVKFRREGRESVALPNHGGESCDRIVFAPTDNIKGPMHTNDDFAICGSPTLGRNASDVLEVGSPPKGWMDGGCSNDGTPTSNNFKGTFVTTAPVLKPPSTNARLKIIAGPSYTFSCQTEIKLEGTNMKVTTRTGTSTIPFPSSGVVYIAQGACPNNGAQEWGPCSSSYSPFTATYPSGSDCGTVRVYGTYSGELTIAAENDVIVWGNIERTGQGLLGLIANNFVRVRHPFSDTNDTVKGKCDSGSNQSGSLTNPRIEAAILAIDHSFIVDHYDCGDDLGTLTVKGAISQKFRGAVGTTAGTGYIKNYEYDDRLRYMEPPNFLDPIAPAWHIQRETLDYP